MEEEDSKPPPLLSPVHSSQSLCGTGQPGPGPGEAINSLARQAQQLGDTAVSDGNRRRHLFSTDPTPGEHVTARTALGLARPRQRQWEALSEYPAVGREGFLELQANARAGN